LPITGISGEIVWARFGDRPESDKTALWGAFEYTPDKDVLRVGMKVDVLPFSMDQFTIAFTDMTATRGKLALMWDKTMASVPFKVGN
jgi:hypothetical protein